MSLNSNLLLIIVFFLAIGSKHKCRSDLYWGMTSLYDTLVMPAVWIWHDKFHKRFFGLHKIPKILSDSLAVSRWRHCNSYLLILVGIHGRAMHQIKTVLYVGCLQNVPLVR